MHPTDRRLCALVRQMTGQTRPSASPGDKFDYERAERDAPMPNAPQARTRRCQTLLRLVTFLGLALLVHHLFPIGSHLLAACHRGWGTEQILALDDLCPQANTITPLGHAALLESIENEFNTTDFKLKAYASLGGAVRIPTESYDDLGKPGQDPRWDTELDMHSYLESRFPKVHANLKRTKVNTYALVYEWKGTDNVKPLLLAAHMDVVPVNPDTYDDWVHPPYSGYYDGEWIWGRGSCDDKPGLIGSLTALETLLERDFVPSRTVLLAFGTDEESSGSQGAGAIAEYLLDTYGPDSLAMIVDEGGGLSDHNGVVFSTPAVAEKGYMDIRMDVLTPGGHSSVPPKHTGIGILADLITTLEAHPHQPELVRGRTYYQALECRAKYEPGFPVSLKRLLKASQTSDKHLRELERHLLDFDSSFYAMSGTTQAVDLIGGGVKVNALPEAVYAVVNHRIVDHSSPAELMDRFTDVVMPVAGRHNMTLEAFGETVHVHPDAWGTVRLSHAFSAPPLAPAPVSPTTGSGPWQLLSGTIRSTVETHLRTDDLPKTAIVSPGLMTGNTDTRYYWNLTQHIFRYGHRTSTDVYNGIHTVNEAIRAEGFLEQIRFFTRLILNADQSALLD